MAKSPLEGAALNIQIGSNQISARAWGNPRGKPLLAIHGWLDNCASFDDLAPLISSHYIVCIDCAGHGHSYHHGGFTGYSVLSDVGDVFRVADYLGWSEFSLMGHSRGGMVAFMAAGTFPSRILNLILLEGIAPPAIKSENAPERLAKSITEINAARKRPERIYSTFEQAVDARVNGIFSISKQDALTLAKYGVVKTERGFTWRYDPKLMAASEMGLNLNQIEAFYQNITARCLLFVAEDGLIIGEPFPMAWIKSHPKLATQFVSGDHHFHMHAHSKEIGLTITQWLNE